MSRFFLAALLALPFVAGQLTPTGPAPGDKFKEGGDCTIEWTADTTGAWKKFNIELMSGPNDPMIHLTTVASGLDGTDPTKTSFTYPCPTVTPHAPIYFYQFTAEGITNVTWTGRWSITDATGTVSTPPNATEPDGSSIPWGQGFLSTPGTPPPSTAPAGQIDGSQLKVGQNAITGTTGATPGNTSVPPTTAPANTPTPAVPSATTALVATPNGNSKPGSSTGFVTVTSNSPGFTPISNTNSTGTTTGSSNKNNNNNNGAIARIASPLTVLFAAVLGAFMI